ncbi:MAG: Obg family GTPase CgtA [Candidatus Omnitrophica bacterium]|nr:Obg family GTPase CgtA [Candidatus Omnitrophota bacterium]
MWFVDHAQITVQAGDGGRGCSAFAQPPYTRFPYPDGGDGGDGGDVIMLADPQAATLLDFHFRHEFRAGRGGHGGSNKRAGKRGEPRLIRVPVGTVIREAVSGNVLRDLAQPHERVVITKGGRGGLGNATATEAGPGAPGETRQLVLELKLIADVGLVGAPNAGKSSLLARISTARPKIGAYPFTTRYPVLGVVNVDLPAAARQQAGGRRTFVACDIPGLIEGAHAGKGLGIQFLRHVERTRLLVHLVDAAAVDGRDPVESLRQVNRELAEYDPELARKPQLVAANKMDLPAAQANLERLAKEAGRPVWPISCSTGQGIPALLQAVWDALHTGHDA